MISTIFILLTINIFLATDDDFLSIGMQEGPKNPLDHSKQVYGPISYVMESNISLSTDGYYVKIPSYRVETNNKGIREESFSDEKPEDVKRILFLGDSFTFGWGVNSSDRFSDIVEKKLNNESSTRYQAINAGIPGYGLEDNLILFRERGISYEPDIVVVSFSFEDVLSTRRSQIIRKKAKNLTPSGDESKIEQKEIKLQRKFVKETSIRGSNFSKHILAIDRLAQKNNMEAIFFNIDRLSKAEKQFYRNLEESNDINIVYPPKQFESSKEKEYTISDKDPHYNALGHQWLGKKLYRYLDQRFEEWNTKNLSVFQTWANKCVFKS